MELENLELDELKLFELKVGATDGLPTGHDTPEGAACDLARSFINRDERLFSSASMRT
jgi:hypothetical protein